MANFRFLMANSSSKRLPALQIVTSWGGLVGPALGLATFFVKRGLPHIKNLPKRKFGAGILENLGSKTCFLLLWSIAGFKMMFLGFQMAN